MDFSKSRLMHPATVFWKKKNDDSYVLANAEEQEFSVLELEGTAANIWEQLVKSISYKDLLEWMYENYDGDKTEIENDLNEFLEELLTKKYLLQIPLP
jgi:DNA-directed RNA polymerase delta subunit